MKNQAIPFRARARTIDHLGKGQIADCPTAVSELWKNSYDAYARDVVLHTFDGDFQTGVIADNGCGMTIDQLIDSWLVVGTESKSKKKSPPPEDMFNLPERKTQGEKGIGRLSTAFLAPVTMLVTKKNNTRYCAALIDWRLFENTYLSLEDIHIPLSEFENLDALDQVVEQLVLELRQNLRLPSKARAGLESDHRIRTAWEKYSRDEKELAHTQGKEIITTENRVLNFCEEYKFDPVMISSWSPLLEKSKDLDGGEHGTALFLLDLDRDLSLLTNPGERAHDNQELDTIQRDLVDTLRAFVNPFRQNEHPFTYEIKTFSKMGHERDILRPTDIFDLESFLSLEHVVQGVVDERGWFNGTIKAFGKDLGAVKCAPNIELDSGRTRVGPFEINIGTFESEPDKTSLSETQSSFIKEQAKKHSGLMVFRDGLRVLPYGRVDNDFFEIEEKRSLNAGRYYWSKRRIFGQILISQTENASLKDKAGREGFIKNQAARELKSIVSSILNDLADRFFGSRSVARRELLAIVKKERESRKEAQTAAKRVTQKAFIDELKSKEPLLRSQFESARSLNVKIRIALVQPSDLDSLEQEMLSLESLRSDLKTPTKPPRLGDHEERYRQYRDLYNEFSAYISDGREVLNQVQSEVNKRSPVQTAKKALERNQGLLNARIGKYISAFETKLANLSTGWISGANEDRSSYYARAITILESVDNGADLGRALNALDALYTDLADTFTIKYEALLKVLNRLADGIDLDSAFSMAEEEKTYFEDKAKNIQSLAQLGISVEILAHELDAADSSVTKGLNSLPSEIKKHPGYITAFNAHKSLSQQIRFLSPLKLSGYQLRRLITGKEIQQHLESFFGDRFERQRVQVIFTNAFAKISIKDLPSRIFPVFVNLMNNALYWVRLSEERIIKLDVADGEVIFANSGPPVDSDDVPRLFELFYSRRANGNGVGLYLCRENLAVARHKIRYEDDKSKQVIVGGANFAINFNGMESEE